MSFMSLRMTRGWYTETPSCRGLDGTRIPEFGITARPSGSEPASESVGSEVMDGAGIIGIAIGMTDT